MGVGDDVAVRRIDDDARSPRSGTRVRAAGASGGRPKKRRKPGSSKKGLRGARDRAAHGDVDHRRRRALDHRRKRGQRRLRENRGGKRRARRTAARPRGSCSWVQPRWGAMSDRARVAQVPARASLDFPACERAGGQTVRILWLFFCIPDVVLRGKVRLDPAGPPRGRKLPEVADRKLLKNKLFYSGVFSIRKSLTPPRSRK